MRATRLRKHIFVALAVGAGVLGAVAPAQACSCREPGVAESIRAADVVFEGRVLAEPESVRAELGFEGYNGALRFRFDVARYYKGQLGSEASVYTIDQESACGTSYLLGSDYLVYAALTEDGLLTDFLCSRTRLLARAAEDLELLGEGTAPDPSIVPREVVAEPAGGDGGCNVSARGTAPGWGAVSSAAMFVLALLRRRRARGSMVRGSMVRGSMVRGSMVRGPAV